jgi:hypothetical protein
LRILNAWIVALVALVPAVAAAQAGDDEFYEDRDETSATAPEAQAETETGGEEGTEGAESDVSVRSQFGEVQSGLPFRNSVFIYENAISAAHPMDLSPDATFYYGMSYSLRPRYYIRDWFSLRLRLDLEQELTDSSTTTSLREPILSDTTLDFYFQHLLAGVSEAFDLEAFLRFGFPSSKASQARTQYLSGTAGFYAYYTAPVLAGLRIGYGFNVAKYFDQYSSATQEVQADLCMHDSDSCLGSGARNPSWLLRNTLSVEFSPIEDLTLSVSVIFYDYFLYNDSTLTTADLPVDVVTNEPSGETIAEDPLNTSRRSNIWYTIDISYNITPYIGLSIGTSTLNPQLAPDSTYYAPFFNRYTQVYLDVNLTIDEVVQAIRNRRNRRSAESRPANEV